MEVLKLCGVQNGSAKTLCSCMMVHTANVNTEAERFAVRAHLL